MYSAPVIALLVAVLLALGSQATLAQEDLTPPVLLDVQFDPQTIDTSRGPATITVTVHVTDDLSGMRHVALFFAKPGTTQRAQVEFRPDEGWSEIVKGDILDGHHRATMTIPRYAAYGEWLLTEVGVEDWVGNLAWMTRPSEDEKGRATDWPALYNGFVFAVGEHSAPSTPTPRPVYLPLLR